MSRHQLVERGGERIELPAGAATSSVRPKSRAAVIVGDIAGDPLDRVGQPPRRQSCRTRRANPPSATVPSASAPRVALARAASIDVRDDPHRTR